MALLPAGVSMSEKATVLLEHHLKELKLPTFLREYGKMAGAMRRRGSRPSRLPAEAIGA